HAEQNGHSFTPMWPAVHDTLHRYAIRGEDLDAMIDGQLLDQQRTRYANFDELRDYCYKVASTVGLVCISVWGCDDMTRARELAIQRGLAFQMTNIIRDIAEDAGRERIYLPMDELDRFGYSEQDLLALRNTTGFDALMQHQIDRARRLYAAAAPLDRLIHPECRATSWALNRIYIGLLERIAAQPRRVLTERVGLSRLSKLAIALRASVRSKLA
ncbi:MAG: squalene/phytoene synthase family protein, partial [Rhodospirillales bacterium]|nr:squalene/phytoene synthase family protein [Rhodospirillales bacterium]